MAYNCNFFAACGGLNEVCVEGNHTFLCNNHRIIQSIIHPPENKGGQTEGGTDGLICPDTGEEFIKIPDVAVPFPISSYISSFLPGETEFSVIPKPPRQR